MITWYSTTPHRYPIESFAELWQPDLADSVAAVGYGELDLAAAPVPGLHVLTDFERLTPDELALAVRLRRRLQAPGHRVLGDPGAWPDRHTLLARLHEAGINDFRAWRVDEIGRQVRFPVFLRWADLHSGSIGGPVADRRVLRRRLARLRERFPEERIAEQLLVVELLDVRSDDGLYRKYSVMRVGDRFVPVHMVLGTEWVTKVDRVAGEEVDAEERRFLVDPPDLDVVTRVFELAGVEFGRVDWGYVDGRPQVWEINSNPMLAPRTRRPTHREANVVRQSELIRDALLALLPDEPARRGPWVRWPERRRWQPVVAAAAAVDEGRPALKPRPPAPEGA